MKKHTEPCLAKDELHYDLCPETLGQYRATRKLHDDGCISSESDHLGACLISRGKTDGGTEMIHATYCTLSDDLHRGPCRNGEGVASRATELGKAAFGSEITGTTELRVWTPESPVVEVNHHRPDGLSIQMSAEIPAGNLYGPDDALSYLSRTMESMMTRISEVESSNLTTLPTNG